MGGPEGLLACNAPLGVVATATRAISACENRCNTEKHLVFFDFKTSRSIPFVFYSFQTLPFIILSINFIALKNHMNYPKDETGKILFAMQKADIDLSVPHTIVFFHLFESQEKADVMATHLAEIAPDITCDVHIDENPKVWHLDCSINTIPLYDVIIAQEAQFEKIVSEFKGYTDGWGIEA